MGDLEPMIDILIIGLFWVAVKELNLKYHNMDVYQIVWFLNYGNLI